MLTPDSARITGWNCVLLQLHGAVCRRGCSAAFPGSSLCALVTSPRAVTAVCVAAPEVQRPDGLQGRLLAVAQRPGCEDVALAGGLPGEGLDGTATAWVALWRAAALEGCCKLLQGGCGHLLQHTWSCRVHAAESHVSAVSLVLLALAHFILSSACRSLLPTGGSPCLGHLKGRRFANTIQA